MSGKTKKSKKCNQVCIVHFTHVKEKNICNVSDAAFTKIKQVLEMRMSQPSGSGHRMSDICKEIPDELETHHGFHRKCYQLFTNKLKKLLPQDPVEDSALGKDRSKRKKNDEKDGIFFQPNCIFCNKNGPKYLNNNQIWEKQNLLVFQQGGWENVWTYAQEKNDEKLLCRIRGYDLAACQAKYHRRCRSIHCQKPEKWRSKENESKTDQNDLENAHALAFECVIKHINKSILDERKLLKLSYLRDLYIKELQNTKFPNSDYRNENLKAKIEKHHLYADTVSFISFGDMPRSQFYILYDSSLSVEEAIRLAYKLGNKDTHDEVAMDLKDTIL